MACIYRAEHLGLRRQVALKVLTGEVAAGAESHQRFLREARIAAAIKHPSVVDIYDVGVHEDVPYLVMELLVGHDLEAYLTASGVPDESPLLDLVIPVVAALAAVHDAGVVHRDLKPGNIFLSKRADGGIEPRLLDFGISRSFWRNEPRLTAVRQGVLIGTPLYMSPEAMLGREITPLSDQYSLGVVLYECTSGVNPFVANNIADIVRRVTTGDYTPLEEQPLRPSRPLTDLINRAMSVDPAQRFPDMRALGRELMMLAGARTRLTWGHTFGAYVGTAALARRAPERPPLPPPPPPAPRWGSRTLLLGVAAVVGGAGFASGVMLISEQRRHAMPTHERPAHEQRAAVPAPTAHAPQSEVAALRPGRGAPAAAANRLEPIGSAVVPAVVAPAPGASSAAARGDGAGPAAAAPAAAGSAPRGSGLVTPASTVERAPVRRAPPPARRPAPPAPRKAAGRQAADADQADLAATPAGAAAEREAPPEWFQSPARPAPPRRPPRPIQETGTNDAPILD
jgi:serine/threonine-protein kinase